MKTRHTVEYYKKWLLKNGKTTHDLRRRIVRDYLQTFRRDDELFDWLVDNYITAHQLKSMMEVV